jgi:arylsulfatase
MSETNKPNLIFVMPDQLRADFLPVYGCSAISTPNIDDLAAQAVVFERAYSNCPLCVPARAALLSGLNPLRSGVLSNHQWLRPDLTEMGLRTWPDLLRDAGYRTAAIGKMHFHPFDAMEGFDERVIAEDKRWVKIHDDYAEFMAQHGLTKFDARQHPNYQKNMGAVSFPHTVELTPDRFVAEASVEFIRRQPVSRPFALMVGFPSPHCPYDALPVYAQQVDPSGLPPLIQTRTAFFDHFVKNHQREWHALDYSEFSDEARQNIRIQYAGLVKQLDEEIGTIIAACKEKGIWDNTLFVLSSDHGDHVGDRRMVGKGDFYEESIHIPLIMKTPGQQEGFRLNSLVELQQIPPTMMQCAGVPVPEWWDYAPLPGKEAPSEGEVHSFGILSDSCMVRKGPWKLMDYQVSACSELYNLDKDPAEIHNCIDDPECQSIRVELADALRFWMHRQAFLGHEEKHMIRAGGLSENPSFARRGWRREYPLPIFHSAIPASR